MSTEAENHRIVHPITVHESKETTNPKSTNPKR